MKFTITPIFNTQEIINSTIKKDWFEFQLRAFALGKRMALYMQHYINANRKRQGGTGNLAKAITFEGLSVPGTVSWGVGNIDLLNTRAKYWYVINYGKTVGGKAFVPPANTGSFGGNPPDSNKIGKGTEQWTHPGKYFMRPKRAVRPINYIESTYHRMNKEIIILLTKSRKG